MFSRIWLCLWVSALALVACTPPGLVATPGPPPVFVTDVPYTGQDEFIGVVIDSIKPLRRGEGSPNEQIELRLVIIGTDAEGRSGGVFCPGAQPLLLNVGDTVMRPCPTLLAFDQSAVGDEFYLLIVAVDEDDISLAADLGIDVGMQGLAFALEELVTTSSWGAPSAGPAGIVVAIGIQIADLVAGRAIDYFQEADLVGQQGLVLYRSRDWGAGHDMSFRTQDNGLDIRFHIVRMQSGGQSGPVATLPLPGESEVLPAEPLARLPDPPTPAPPTPIPQYIDRLVLIDPARGEVMTLRDGATVDLGSYGRYLDVVAEVNSSRVGSVTFLLDGRSFCPHERCFENAPPFVMGGDLSGVPYGDWDWSGLAGAYTIGAYACTHTNGGGECSEPVTYRITVRR